MADKLSIINSALRLTGNEPVTENDGSPSWEVASEAFDVNLPLLIARRDWGFASAVVQLAAAASNPSVAYAYAYVRPAACLQLLDLYERSIPVTSYEIVDNLICCDAPNQVSAKIRRLPDDASWAVGFTEVLKLKVMAGIYRGLHEDPAEGQVVDRQAEGFLEEIASLASQEHRGRVMMKSRISARRRWGGQPR
ncbi:hypothetical protein [Xanthobacter flavus]|uniref:hypothetical protein n=1 Tax=Xanthobacter flavus TaxID=281 RepID=UPI003726DD5D